MIILSHHQLKEILTTLPEHYPRSRQFETMIQNRLNGRYTWPGTEFVTDRYPDYGVLLFRPTKNSPDFINWPSSYCVTIFCRNVDSLAEAVLQDDFVDWRQQINFYALSKNDVWPIIIKRSKEMGNTQPAAPPLYDQEFVHLLHPSHLVKSDVPEGFHLGELTEAHAEQVNAEWKHGDKRSLEFFRYILRNRFPTSGAFTADGRLMAYILYKLDGSIFNGFVQPEFRNKGLYQVVNYDLVSKVVAMGQATAWCYVMPTNTPSLKAYAKMGAKRIDPEEFSVEWHWFTPEGIEPGL